MDLKEYIKSELDGLKRGQSRILKDLTQQDLAWRPSSGCNSMGLILFHVVKGEDSFIQATLQGKPDLWTSGKWYQKLNLPETETGNHYTVDQVNCFAVPAPKDILAYYDAVRAETLRYLASLTPADFERKVKLPFGEFTVAGVFSVIVSHTAQHNGEIGYLRGMLKGMDK
jgi:hypothetical protein